LVKLIKARFDADYHVASVGRLLHRLDFSHISARPQHPKQDPEAIEAFNKNFPQTLAESLKNVSHDTPTEIWFQDEARVGQKNGQVYQWAPKGTRPPASATRPPISLARFVWPSTKGRPW